MVLSAIWERLDLLGLLKSYGTASGRIRFVGALHEAWKQLWLWGMAPPATHNTAATALSSWDSIHPGKKIPFAKAAIASTQIPPPSHCESPFRTLVPHAVTCQLDDLQNLENQLARKIRAELLNLFPQPSGSSCPLPNLETTLNQIGATASHDSHTDAADFVTSEIPEQITEQTLTRIATSSGILVLGETASTWTLGVGVAIALGADYLWDWITKPTADIAREVGFCIEELGNTGTEALQSECSRLVSQRCEQREEATQRLIAQLTPILGGA